MGIDEIIVVVFVFVFVFVFVYYVSEYVILNM